MKTLITRILSVTRVNYSTFKIGADGVEQNDGLEVMLEGALSKQSAQGLIDIGDADGILINSCLVEKKKYALPLENFIEAATTYEKSMEE